MRQPAFGEPIHRRRASRRDSDFVFLDETAEATILAYGRWRPAQAVACSAAQSALPEHRAADQHQQQHDHQAQVQRHQQGRIRSQRRCGSDDLEEGAIEPEILGARQEGRAMPPGWKVPRNFPSVLSPSYSILRNTCGP